MSIAIIGSGKMGSGFARLLAAKGFEVAIGHKNPEKAVAGDLANKIVIDISNPSHPTSKGLLSGIPRRPQKKFRKSFQVQRS